MDDGSRVPASEERLVAEFQEFLRVADRLAMPDSERLGVLGLSREAWWGLVQRPALAARLFTSANRRRLSYVLPLMRRSLANLDAPAAAS
ncbi:MAG: hypothetical protein JO209_00390 [Acidisphaera sp.]|nr:hypothetical protein [Acidisphaera sp.]